MPDEPRYTEAEVKEIFERAAHHSQTRALSSPEGFTLPELQAIGREAGLEPERIAEAASQMELRRSALPARTQLGMPVAVGRSVPLPRAPTDKEWEEIVAELRSTFMAVGKEWSSGKQRQWTNGNLHAFIERYEGGVRLRMGTLKGDALPVNLMSAGLLALATLILVVMVIAGGPLGTDLLGPIILGAAGAAGLGANAIRLPAWAAEREAQMEHIGSRARALLGTGDRE